MSIAEVVIANFEMPTETGFEQYIAQIKLGSDANAIFFSIFVSLSFLELVKERF